MSRPRILPIVVFSILVFAAGCGEQEGPPPQGEHKATAVKYCSAKYKKEEPIVEEKLVTVKCSSPLTDCACNEREIRCGDKEENVKATPIGFTWVPGSCEHTIVSE